jgi:hypothetical protein
MKIEVSLGEVIDKVTILEIKLERIEDAQKAGNIRFEYDLLRRSMEEAGITTDSDVFQELKAVNCRLWDIEDAIRKKERDSEFDDEFIRLARSVYLENDRRAAIKRRINIEAGSKIIEEKKYVDYGGSQHG